jgi:hypothetical protein
MPKKNGKELAVQFSVSLLMHMWIMSESTLHAGKDTRLDILFFSASR